MRVRLSAVSSQYCMRGLITRMMMYGYRMGLALYSATDVSHKQWGGPVSPLRHAAMTTVGV
jgi:hypothetical protein